MHRDALCRTIKLGKTCCRSLHLDYLTKRNNIYMEFIITLIIAILSGVATKVVDSFFEKQKMDEMEKKLEELKNGFTLPVQVPSKDKRNSVLLVGLGGSGKTSFISSLLANGQANPDERTEKFEIYHGMRRSNKENKNVSSECTSYWFYIADYKGQKIGQLISSFLVQQKRPYSPFAYTYINSLVFLVDLLPPPKNQNDKDLTPQNKLDIERVKLHSKEWNDTALDAVFGLLTSELKYVVLFINKVDLMANRTEKADESYKQVFDELSERIRKRCGKAQFDVILGSAKNGTSMNIVETKMMAYSVSNNDISR